VSAANGLGDLRARWRRSGKRWRRILDRRLALNRWYPHFFIALAIAPLGLLLVAGAVEQGLGVHLRVVELAHLEQSAGALQHRPILECALGLSLIAMSVGVAMRSRLGWLWSTTVSGVTLALRLPPERVDIMVALYCGAIFFLLLLHRRSFGSRSVVNAGVFAVVALLTFFTWATLGTLRLGDQFHPPVGDLATALYVAVVTVSSVGFGDIVPRSPEARLFVVAMIALGILVTATVVSAILLPLIGGRLRNILGGKPNVDRTNHYVIVGKSPLARNAALELEKRKQGVTLILDVAPDEDFYQRRDVVVGDATDLSVLRTAGTEAAKGVLALSTDDSTNGFVVLGVNELDASIPTVAALNDPGNQFRLKRSQPSMILSLQALGGELLAMALTGERVDMEMLTRVLQVHGSESGSGG
jgi:voltage-gated potassium channel